MIKQVLLAVTLLFTANTMAASCSDQINQVSGLTDEAKQTMVIACEQAKLTANTTDATVEQVDKWSEISLKFAKALGVAANELGVAANTFLDTPAGKLTAAFIAWKVMGNTATLIVAGLLGLIFFHFLAKAFRRILTTSGYEEKKTRWGTKKVPILEPWRTMADSACFFTVLSYALEAIFLIVIVANI